MPRFFSRSRSKSPQGTETSPTDGTAHPPRVSSLSASSLIPSWPKISKTSSTDASEEKEVKRVHIASFLESYPHLDIDELALTQYLDSLSADAAIDFLEDFRDATEGVLKPSKLGEVPWKGIENAGNSCYIDSLIVAMFGKESVFDALLTRELPNAGDAKSANLKRLQITLRLVVNQLRDGKLVSRYTMHRLRLDLIRSGWEGTSTSMACWSCQEDASELFLFLTSAFSAPFLPIEEVLFHGGAADKDDERVFTERMLQLGIPEEAKVKKMKGKTEQKDQNGQANGMVEGDSLHLEDILMESFFSSKVKVERTLDAPGNLKISVDAWQANRLLPFFTPQNEAGDDVGAGAEKFLSNSMMIPLLLK
ncbi:hypothetical protein HK097_001853, partial [Rhizophlyctis rosea]